MLNVYAVRDVKADSYGALICMATVGLAKRVFLEVVQGEPSSINQFPEDYSLYELGSYDPSSGALKAHIAPVYVCSAVEMVAMKSKPVDVVAVVS